MILLRDQEVKNFNNFTDAEDFLQKQTEADEWRRIPIWQLKVHPLPYNPICLNMIMKEYQISSSEEATLSAMNDTNLLLSYPGKNNKQEVLPIRATGINSLKERAKLFGTSLQKMPCEKKAITLNCGLEIWKEQSLVLIRDEKVSAIHSGDEADYTILPMNELVGTLRKELEENYKGFEVKNIEVGHEFTVITVELDESIMSDFNKILVSRKRKPVSGKPILKFASSDVGMSGANLYPYICVDGTYVRMGEVLRVKHKNHATIGKFADNCRNMYSSFKKNDFLERLLDYKVKNPRDCFLAVAKKCSLPKKAVFEALEDFEAFRPVECYAYDIYMGLWEITRYSKTTTQSQLLNLEENISRAMHLDYAYFDHSFNWI